MRDGPRRFRQDFTCPALLRILLGSRLNSCTGLSPSMILPFQIISTFNLQSMLQSYNPPKAVTFGVWAVPLSLATTKGITTCFLFLRVLRCFSSPGILLSMLCLQHNGFPHSDICGSKVIRHLPAAYRSLSRPSSSSRAKASSIRPYLLSRFIIVVVTLL